MTGYINSQGTLEQIITKIKPSTVQYAYEIMNDKRTDESIREIGFSTADFPLYILDHGAVFLHMPNHENNPLFQNFDNIVTHIKRKKNYFPKNEEIENIINAKTTIKINLSDLKLQKYTDEVSYFQINTSNYHLLNRSQRILAEQAYGQGTDFINNMAMLKEAGITTIQINVLNPEYVKNTLANKSTKNLARLSFLYNFRNKSTFDMCNGKIKYANISLRALPSEKQNSIVKDYVPVKEKYAIKNYIKGVLKRMCKYIT